METHNKLGQPVEEYKAEPGGDHIFAIRHEDDNPWTLWCERGADRDALLDEQGRPMRFGQPDVPVGLFTNWAKYEDMPENPALRQQWLRSKEACKASPWPGDLSWKDLEWKQGPWTADC